MLDNEPYVLLDLRGLILHSYYSGKDGEPKTCPETGRKINSWQYGFEVFIDRYVFQIYKDYYPQKTIACLEGGNARRKSIDPIYKQNRKKSDSALEHEQLTILQEKVEELLVAIGATTARVREAEADDMIAFLCDNLDGHKVIYTRDGDLAALSSDTVHVFCREELVEKGQYGYEYNGVPVKLLTLYKTLVGDSSDNIKGIKGFGPKAWEGLVNRYGYDGLLELFDLIKSHNFKEIAQIVAEQENQDKVLMAIVNNEEVVKACLQLSSLHPEWCEGIYRDGGRPHLARILWEAKVADADKLTRLLKEVGCLEWLGRFQEHGILPTFIPVSTDDEWETLQRQFFSELAEAPFVSWDYESYDPVKHEPFKKAVSSTSKSDYVDVLSQGVVGCSFAVGKNTNKVYYLSCGHVGSTLSKDKISDVLIMAKKLGKELVAHNSMFEATLTLTNFGYIPHSLLDTKLLAAHLFENDFSNLKHLSKVHLGYSQITYKEVIGDRGDMSNLTVAEVLQYACDDSLVTAKLYSLFSMMADIEGTLGFVKNFECPSLAPLVDSFVKGVKIDMDKLGELRKRDEEKLPLLEGEVRSLLEEHCHTPNDQAAKDFVKAEEAYIEAVCRDKGQGRDEIEKTKLQMMVEASEMSVYIPLREVKKPGKFYATAGAVTMLGKSLGFTKELAATNKKSIAEYLIAVDEDIRNSDAEQKRLQRRFCALLGKVNFNKKDDAAFEEYKDFCISLLEETAPTVTVGTPLNLGSPKQMQYLLYCMLGLPVRLRSKVQKDSFRDKHKLEGSPATDEDAMLTAMADDIIEGDWRGKVIENILEIKEIRTRFSYYWDTYPLWAHPRDGMVHPSVISCGTVTHRPTGNNPNIFQVAKNEVRSIYVPRQDGNVYVSIDFAGQELRLQASECLDRNMLACYLGDKLRDMHTTTAVSILRSLGKYATEIASRGGYLYEVIDALRKEDSEVGKFVDKIRSTKAKPTNFNLQYGGGISTLKRKLRCTEQEAKDYYQSYYQTYPGIEDWREKVIAFAGKTGYVNTAFGTRRHVYPDIVSNDKQMKSRMERQACNYKIQGCAADILKVVLATAWEREVWQKHDANLIAGIYDEVLNECPISNLVGFITEMCAIMSITPPGHTVPMVPEVSIGWNWYDQIEIGQNPCVQQIEEGILKLEDKRNETKSV